MVGALLVHLAQSVRTLDLVGRWSRERLGTV
jgi:hypothetical protein